MKQALGFLALLAGSGAVGVGPAVLLGLLAGGAAGVLVLVFLGVAARRARKGGDDGRP